MVAFDNVFTVRLMSRGLGNVVITPHPSQMYRFGWFLGYFGNYAECQIGYMTVAGFCGDIAVSASGVELKNYTFPIFAMQNQSKHGNAH